MTRRMPEKNIRTSGFTLLELLLALALTSLLAVVLYASLYVAFKSRDTAIHAMDSVQRASNAFTLMAQDFDGALPPNTTFSVSFEGTPSSIAGAPPASSGSSGSGSSGSSGAAMGAKSGGLSADSTLSAAATGLHAPSNDPQAAVLLAFYAASNSPHPGEFGADIRKVEFSFETPDGATKPALVRRSYYNLLPSKTPEPRVQVLCRNVRSVYFRYWDGLLWREDWDSPSQGNILPTGVEVTLEIEASDSKTGDAPTYKLTRVFSLTCGVSASQANTNSGGSQ